MINEIEKTTIEEAAKIPVLKILSISLLVCFLTAWIALVFVAYVVRWWLTVSGLI